MRGRSSRSSTTTWRPPRPTSRRSGRRTCSARSRSGSRCGSAACARASSARSAAPPRSTPTARTSRAAPRAYGLQPLRWPDPFPPDAEWAMLVATYAKQIGRAVAFSLAAFRQAYAARARPRRARHRALAAAACEMHPVAVEKGARPAARSARRLDEATAAAAAAGVLDVPAVRVGDRVFHGDRELEAAAAVLGGMKANREYELSVRRGGRGPALLAGPHAHRPHRGGRDRHRRGGAVLGHAPAQTGRLARGLRADLASARGRRLHREVAPLAGRVSGGRTRGARRRRTRSTRRATPGAVNVTTA